MLRWLKAWRINRRVKKAMANPMKPIGPKGHRIVFIPDKKESNKNATPR